MEITIGHLYYDLMNLYGEIGNIKVLTYHLKNQGIKVNIKNFLIFSFIVIRIFLPCSSSN